MLRREFLKGLTALAILPPIPVKEIFKIGLVGPTIITLPTDLRIGDVITIGNEGLYSIIRVMSGGRHEITTFKSGPTPEPGEGPEDTIEMG